MGIEELLCKISQITNSNYAFYSFDSTEILGVLMIASEELLDHYMYLQGEIESLKTDMEENMKPITKEEQIYG